MQERAGVKLKGVEQSPSCPPSVFFVPCLLSLFLSLRWTCLSGVKGGEEQREEGWSGRSLRCSLAVLCAQPQQHTRKKGQQATHREEERGGL